MALSTLGTDPDYASLLGGGNRDPRLLMAQKLMDVGAMPTNNSTQSSFWANLLNQGARGALGGYLYKDAEADREKEATAQATEAAEFTRMLAAGPPGSASVKDGGGGGTAPAPRADAGGGGTSGGSAGGDLVAAVHHLESRGRTAPGIYGDGGAAAGPMQVHAGALADVNRAQGTNYTHEQLAANPELGLQVGAAYLAQLRQQFGRDDYALGAYNAGPGAMRAAIASGQGVAGLPARTQQYVSEGLSRMRGRQADASPAPGSNIDALMAGVDQPKPRGIQLAERVALGGGGDTATDSPTPILPAPRAPVVSAALQGAPGPQPPSATVPDPPPALVPPPPPATVSGPPALSPATPEPAIVPQPEPATVPQPEPAIVPGPEPAIVPQPEPAIVPPPMANADPASLANRNGIPQPEPAVVPPPEPAVVPPPDAAVVPPPPEPTSDPPMIAPAGSGETGGQPTIPPPVQGPPIPPGPVRTSRSDALARRLQQAAPAPPAPPAGGDNATEALNTASLAAARAGQNFDPRAPTSPTGPQLAAPLMSWAGNLTDAGAPLLTPAGGPTGPQLAAPLQPPGAPGAASQQGGPVPLVTPASDATGAPGATTDTSATGGQSKGAASSAPATAASTADSQAQADWYLKMARQAQASSNPRIRAQAGMLEAQGQALQRRIDRQDVLDQQLGARRDAASERAADRAATREDRQLTHQENLDLRRQTAADTAAGRAESAADRKERIELERRRVELEEKKANAEHGPYSGKSVPAEDRNIVDRLHESIANGTASEADKRRYSVAYNSLKDGADYDAPDPQHPGQSIRVPGHPTDLTGYAPPPYRDTTPKPGKAPTEAERKAAGYATRMAETTKTLDQIGSQTFGDVLAGRVPMVGNYLTSDQGQQFQTAARAWIWAKLRQESGAAVPPEEARQEFETYFPQPGDTPARIAQKRRLRDLETQNMQRDAGNAYTAAPEQAATGGGGSPLPADKSQLQPGTVYTLRGGRRGKWNGTDFDEVR